MKYQHLLVPVDFSDGSKRAIEKAVELAEFYQAKISLLSVVEPLPVVAYSYMGSAEIEGDLLNHANEQLNQWGISYNIPRENQHLISGHTKTEICEQAKKLGCDLIVIGSHGHHSLLSNLLGSTTDAVSHHANCDVFIVKAKAR